MGEIISTDVVIVGAGPAGLFAVFELGLLDIKTHLIDILPEDWGPMRRALSGKADLRHPRFPGRLRAGAGRQPRPADPPVQSDLPSRRDGGSAGDAGNCRNIRNSACAPTPARRSSASASIVAAGGGSFQPKKPPIPGIDAYEGKSVFYSVRKIEQFRERRVMIVGGGDSALDWVLNLHPVARRITLVHRRDAFRAAPHSVNAMRELVAAGQDGLRAGSGDRPQGRRRPAQRRDAAQGGRRSRSTARPTTCCRSSA